MSRGPYSYSRLATFKKCLAKFKYAYIDKVDVPFIPSPAMARGTEIHNSLEQFMLGHSEMLHPDIHEHYGQFFLGLREAYKDNIYPEHRWGLTWDFTPCDYDDDNVMLRGFMDLKFVPEDEHTQVYEYKTGKIYPEHTHQQWMYGVVALQEHPLKSVEVTVIYLDQKKNKKIYYPQGMMGNYRVGLMEEIQEVEDKPYEEFIPNPQFTCRWCQFSKDNGGPCRF
jgi:hypothetical protein